MRTKSLQTHFKSYNQYLPFAYIIVFKRQGSFNEMVSEAIRKYPSLEPLRCDDPVKSNVISFVYSPHATNHIFLFATEEMTLDILLHESVHVVARIFESIGADINEHTEEFFAYIQEMIFRDTLEIMKDKFGFTPGGHQKKGAK